MIVDFGRVLGTSKEMQGAEERRQRRISNKPQGEATEGNAANDTLMVDQGPNYCVDAIQ